MDFILKKEFKTDHEKITTHVVELFSEQLENDSIPCEQVKRIITKTHQYPFLSSVINGPLDVDKVDYVLRDSYHVGLKYSFDLDHFFDQIRVLGNEDELEKCELGLDKTPEARAGAELFLLLWKSMYTIVYLVESSRIAEKMLEKAILVAIENEDRIKECLADFKNYIDLDEAMLITELKNGEGFQASICNRIFKTAQLYSIVCDFDLETLVEDGNQKFLDDLEKNGDDFISDKISQNLSRIEKKPYLLICDIIRSKIPKEILIDDKDENDQPIEIKQKSYVVEALRIPKVSLKIYGDPLAKRSKLKTEKKIKSEVKHIIESW